MKWTLTPGHDFAKHARAWDTLHLRSRRSPLLTAAFVAPLLALFGKGRAALASCEEQGKVTAMALIVKAGPLSWSTFQPPQAPIGLWLQEAAADTVALAQSLLQALPRTALVFGLTQCDPDLITRPANGRRVRTADYADTARINITGSYNDYWDARGKNLRANLRKQRARLGRAGASLRLQVSRSPQEITEAIIQFAALESAGWKAAGGTAVTHAGDQFQFYRALLGSGGSGCVYRYWMDDRLIAIDLCVEDAKQLIVLKTAYDETDARGLSPAMLMRQDALQAIFAEALPRRVEFYGKAMDWHRRWTDDVRTLFHINVYRWPALARWHGGPLA